MSAAADLEFVESLSDEARQQLLETLRPRLTKYIPQYPTPKQAIFLKLTEREAFYGGAGGGGKSSALLMGALQYVDQPNFAALIIRKTYKQLSEPGALIPRSHEWLAGTDAHWNGELKQWHFPGGAIISFGHIQHEMEKYNYQSAAYDYVAYDELTDFPEDAYVFLFTRMRRDKGSKIPTRMRSASNPGGLGHSWVKARFIDPGHPNRPFIPAKIDDNPHFDQEGYRESLSYLDPVTRRQIEDGDWSVRTPGGYFRREWFEIVDTMPISMRLVRYWDLAASEVTDQNKDPDWTRGCLAGRARDGTIYIAHMAGIRARPGKRDQFIRSVAERDGHSVSIYLEQEPGSGGVAQCDHLIDAVLEGFDAHADRPTGDKGVRARPVSSSAERGVVKVVHGEWMEDYFDELEAFDPDGPGKKDQVDATSGAVKELRLLRPDGDVGVTI